MLNVHGSAAMNPITFSRIASTTLVLAAILSAAAPAAAQAPDNKALAREHFDKGVAAFADRRFAEAAEEFDAAYRISPAFVVLYNIGQVNVALGRSVEAVDAFDQYLKQGASAVSAARRQEVTAEIEKQRARIGTIAVRTFPDGAELRVDGVLVGKTPLARPLRVNAGHHAVQALLAAHAPQSREIDVVGRAELGLELTLEPLVATSPPPVVAPSPPPAPVPAPASEPAAPAHGPLIEKIVIQTPPSTSPSYEHTEIEHVSPPPVAVIETRPRPSINWQRVAGLVITAGGLAAITVGGIDAYRGANQANDANQRLSTASNDADYNAALPDFDAGKRLNQRGWTIAGIGGAVLVGGIIVIATAPERSGSLAIAPYMTANSGGILAHGSW